MSEQHKALNARIVCAIIGIISLIAGTTTLVRSLRYSSASGLVVGEVVSTNVVHDVFRRQRPSRTYPKIKYVVHGVTYSISGNIGSTSMRSPVGQKVEIIYQLADPQDAQINTFPERWLGAAIGIPVGVVLLTWAAIAGRVGLRKGSTNGSHGGDADLN